MPASDDVVEEHVKKRFTYGLKAQKTIRTLKAANFLLPELDYRMLSTYPRRLTSKEVTRKTVL